MLSSSSPGVESQQSFYKPRVKKTPEQILEKVIAKRQAHVIKISQMRQQYYYQMNVRKHPKCPVVIVGRELEVLKLISEGHSNRVVAEMLSERKAIIDGYVICLLNKLKLNTRTQALQAAELLGILSDKPKSD